jgi:hypothetical protein
MRTSVVVPIPFDRWEDFSGPIWQFTYTWKLYPPGVEDYQLIAVANWGEPTDSVRELFYGIKTEWLYYFAHGADLGSHKFAAMDLTRYDTAFGAQMKSDHFMVCMSSRCFFHRAGWLKRFVEAREKYGPGIYGTGVFEGRPHVRTCAFGIDADYLRELPGEINSRQDTVEIESGNRCLTDFVKSKGGVAVQVLWDDEQPDQADWRADRHTEIFRRGCQGAMLVHDRHSKLYEESNDSEKVRLCALSDGH